MTMGRPGGATSGPAAPVFVGPDPGVGLLGRRGFAKEIRQAGAAQDSRDMKQGGNQPLPVRSRPYQRKQHVDLIIFRRTERDRPLQHRQDGRRRRDFVHAGVGYGDALPDAGRAEALAQQQRRQHRVMAPAGSFRQPSSDTAERGTLGVGPHVQKDFPHADEFAEFQCRHCVTTGACEDRSPRHLDCRRVPCVANPSHGSTCGHDPRGTGRLRGMGWSMTGAGTTTDEMHQGQRTAALGNERLQERQTRLEREILMSRSIGAAPMRRRMNRLAVKLPEQVGCGFQGWESLLRAGTRPLPASLETLAKIFMHIDCLPWPNDRYRLPGYRARGQMIAKARAISPNTPMAMINFVVVSIVASRTRASPGS